MKKYRILEKQYSDGSSKFFPQHMTVGMESNGWFPVLQSDGSLRNTYTGFDTKLEAESEIDFDKNMRLPKIIKEIIHSI